MYKREEIESAFGHICMGGGASIKNSPINITVNIHIHTEKDGKIKGVFANAFKGRFRKPVDAQNLIEKLFPGGDNGGGEIRRLRTKLIEADH